MENKIIKPEKKCLTQISGDKIEDNDIEIMDKKCTVGSLYIIYPLFPIYGTVWGKSECLVFYFIIFNL